MQPLPTCGVHGAIRNGRNPGHRPGLGILLNGGDLSENGCGPAKTLEMELWVLRHRGGFCRKCCGLPGTQSHTGIETKILQILLIKGGFYADLICCALEAAAAAGNEENVGEVKRKWTLI